MIPIIDLATTNSPLREELLTCYHEVSNSNCFVGGENTAAFEEEFRNYIGCQHGVSVGNGTDALEIALRAVGVGQNDEVVTVANAGCYATTATLAIGGIPYFADIDAESLLVDVTRLGECITPRTKAVVITHLYGRVVDVGIVRDVLGPKIAIVEDCAQAHGGNLNGKSAGTIGDLATFSFYPTKNLGGMGDGGMVLTNSKRHFESVRMLKQYGWRSRYRIDIPNGRNSRMDEIQAAFLRVKLKHLDEWNTQRREVARSYNASLRQTAYVTYGRNTGGNVHHLYVVQHPKRSHIIESLRGRGVASSIHYPVLDIDQPGLVRQRMLSTDLEVSRQFNPKILTIPCYPGLSSTSVDQVSKCLLDVG